MFFLISQYENVGCKPQLVLSRVNVSHTFPATGPASVPSAFNDNITLYCRGSRAVFSQIRWVFTCCSAGSPGGEDFIIGSAALWRLLSDVLRDAEGSCTGGSFSEKPVDANSAELDQLFFFSTQCSKVVSRRRKASI